MYPISKPPIIAITLNNDGLSSIKSFISMTQLMKILTL